MAFTAIMFLWLTQLSTVVDGVHCDHVPVGQEATEGVRQQDVRVNACHSVSRRQGRVGHQGMYTSTFNIAHFVHRTVKVSVL